MSDDAKPTAAEGPSEVPVERIVGDYPERPYAEAVHPDHKAFLEAEYPDQV